MTGDSSTQIGGDPFEALIRQLRVEGYAEAADQLDTILHHTAWTTGTELLGELGIALRDFTRTRPKAGTELRRCLRTCRRVVRRAWPGLR
jgi:hypothetical protein